MSNTNRARYNVLLYCYSEQDIMYFFIVIQCFLYFFLSRWPVYGKKEVRRLWP